MTYESLIFGIKNGVARITINRPVQLNAMDVLMAKELALATKEFSAESAVRCVVLTGAGDRAFCAGGDVAGFASDPERVDSLIEEGSDLRVRAHAGDAHRRSKRHGSWRRPRPRGGRRSRCRFPVGKIHQRLHGDRAHPRREHDLVHAPPDRSPPDEGAVPFEPRAVCRRGDGLGIGQSGCCARRTGRDGR